MYLKFRQKTRRSIKIDADLKNPLPEPELWNLVSKLRSGDWSVAELIVESHLKLTTSIASEYAVYFPRLEDDLVAESWLLVVEAVNSAANKLYDDNITPYINSTVRRGLCKFLYMVSENAQSTVSDRKQRILESGGSDEDVKELYRSVFNRHEPLVFDTDEGRQTIEIECRNNHNVALREIIRLLPTNLLQTRVLELRSQGYTFQEIAEKTGFCLRTVNKAIHDMEDRFESTHRS